MGYIYYRGNRIWIGYVDENGKRRQKSTGLLRGQEKTAEAILKEIEAALDSGLGSGPVIFKTYARRWLEHRRSQGVRSVSDDESRINNHLLPAFGDITLADIRPKHVRDFVATMRRSNLAPRTQSNIFVVLKTMLRDAVADELIDTSPVILKRNEAPKRVDVNSRWREDAVFSAEELVQLIHSPKIPMGRRITWGLMGMAGMRFGEAAARKWGDILPRKPLNAIIVDTSYNTKSYRITATKTGTVRTVPLAAVLFDEIDRWRRFGWPTQFGRTPSSNDLISPADSGRVRNVNNSLRQFHADLDELGLRRRRQHDLRRSFVTLCRANGAPIDLLRFVSHGRSGAILDQYTTLPWDSVCGMIPEFRLLSTYSGGEPIDFKGEKWRAGRDLNPEKTTPQMTKNKLLDTQTVEIMGEIFGAFHAKRRK